MNQSEFEKYILGGSFEDISIHADPKEIKKYLENFGKDDLVKVYASQKVFALNPQDIPQELSDEILNRGVEKIQSRGADPEPEIVTDENQSEVVVPKVFNLETGEDVTNVEVDTEPNTITVNDKGEDDAAPANNTEEPINTDEEIPEISYHEPIVDPNQVIPFGVVDDTPEPVTGAVPKPAAATADTSVTSAAEANTDAVVKETTTSVNSDSSNNISDVAGFINSRADLKGEFYAYQQQILKSELEKAVESNNSAEIEKLKKAIAYCTTWNSRVNTSDYTYEQKIDKDGNKFVELIKEGTINEVAGRYNVKFELDANSGEYKLVPDWNNKLE